MFYVNVVELRAVVELQTASLLILIWRKLIQKTIVST